MPYSEGQNKASSSALTPVIWYLVNLLALPVIGFAVLLWLYLQSAGMSELRRAHTRATFYMSIIGAVLIFGGVGAFWLAFGHTGNFWTGAIVWAIVLHTSFVLWGMIALAQAIGEKPPYFPRRFL
jgi:phosphoglycerol transferase MdoB-like AlkP superfamily enzyme